MPSDPTPTPTVAVACVTQDRHEDVLALVAALREQTEIGRASCRERV